VACDGVFDWTLPLEGGEVVEHVEDTDRLSCNLSQGSIDSLGENASMARMGGRGSCKDTTGRTGQTGTSTRGSQGQAAQVGPLMRVAKAGKAGSSSDAGDDHHSASLVRAMQSAGVPVEAIKKMGVSHTDKVEDDEGGEGDEGAAKPDMDDLADQ